MSGFRLHSGGRILRHQQLHFSFNGKRLKGYKGDTLASALLANGVRTVSRSIKYHRPRGIVGAGAEESNAILQVGEGARTLAAQRATQVELYDGLTSRSTVGFPDPNRDMGRFLGAFSRMLPAGFYYKTFMWPRSYWMKYEEIIRRAAGWGFAPTEADVDHYDRINAHCDVLIVGAGPAGLAAALAAGRAGARVIIADEQNEFGGSLLSSRDTLDGAPAAEWVRSAEAELARMPEVTRLPRSTVFGYYDHNFLCILQRLTDHLPPGEASGPRQRLWRVRARQVVLCTGAIERPLVFSNNDRPGVMLASAVSTYVNRYAVSPGRRGLIFANNDSAYRTALDLKAAGVTVAAVVDARRSPSGPWVEQVREAGVPVRDGSVVTDVRGGSHVSAAMVASVDESAHSLTGSPEAVSCDFLAVSGGWNPVVHLHAQSGARPVFDETLTTFVPGDSVQAERSAGGANGVFTLRECLEQGEAAGREAARECGFEVQAVALPEADAVTPAPLQPVWLVPSRKKPSRAPKQFVDFQNDTTAGDISLALREGFRSIEHVKRYTLMGFGTDQGKMGNINGMGIVAQLANQDIKSTGTTTFRPAYTAVTFGAIAGRDVGDLLDPVRKTPMHAWHEANGALFENVGQWKRAWYYPRGGETLDEAVKRECLATHESVGVLDYSTLGKIDIRGPGAIELLSRVYTNNWAKLGIGRCRYGIMLGEDGMVLDDGVTTRLGEQHYLMTTSTGNAARVMAWLEQWLQTEWPDLEVYLTSVTDQWATVSVAGPNSRKVASAVCEGIDFDTEAFPFLSMREGKAAGVRARVQRVSFSGELSYEISVPANHAQHVWDAVMEAGKPYNITPYGTETMHVLRAEKGFIIVGQDTDGSVTPVDLGMSWALSKKKDFLGKRSLDRSDSRRTDRRQFVGLLTHDPQTVLPEGAQLVNDPKAAKPMPMTGFVTSSYYGPRMERSIALALVDNGHARMGEVVHAPLADGRVVSAEITQPVFFDPKGERQNV